MTKAPETAPAVDFSETVAGEVQLLIRRLAKPGKDLVKEVISEISYTNPSLLLGAAKIGQLLLFLKERLKPKQYEEALVNSLGWISGIANQLLKLAPILGNFTTKQLDKINHNLSPSALYKLATGRTPVEVIKSMLEKACTQEVSKKDIQLETKKHKENQPKKQPTPWRYAGNGREYQPPRISEKVGLIVEQLSEQNETPRRFVIEEAVLLLGEKFQQVLLAVA
ncbi:hypothetical protein WA1_03760 [Scytonema hofmannii PCC 7110]|uniref:Uncharacterized protein n=1 Tax=Scytonema hofmannii PCC 7110 TaxID=128403 RepID=A0A139X925_9CYAN|nr:hypothetical protein [Scytonema hofmannii]KYC41211.1 hypothetical protein WA1_03760 [Scytonema hofmannii PCC 7110]